MWPPLINLQSCCWPLLSLWSCHRNTQEPRAGCFLAFSKRALHRSPHCALSLAFAAQQQLQDNLKERASAAGEVKELYPTSRENRSLASLRAQHTNPDICNPSAVFYLKVDVKLKVRDGPDPGQEALSRKREIQRGREREYINIVNILRISTRIFNTLNSHLWPFFPKNIPQFSTEEVMNLKFQPNLLPCSIHTNFQRWQTADIFIRCFIRSTEHLHRSCSDDICLPNCQKSLLTFISPNLPSSSATSRLDADVWSSWLPNIRHVGASVI